MKLHLMDIIYSFSYGLDCIEAQFESINYGHAKRVAALCYLMATKAGLEGDLRKELTALASLHDSALTQYLREEQRDDQAEKRKMLKGHCLLGEENIKKLPLSKKAENIILYHHEEADGTGPFGKKSEETPFGAQLIHMADTLDIKFNLGEKAEEKYHVICEYIKKNEGIRFSKDCVTLFLEQITKEDLLLLERLSLNNLLKEISEKEVKEYSEKEIRDLCSYWTRIVDYKSSFTKRHSQDIAVKAEELGRYYGFDDEKCLALYVAGTVHDLGKLTTKSSILEKPDKLSEEEFKHIQNHAYQSWVMLKDIRGLEEITPWAVHHHEKLNGQGYPFQKKGDELSFEERMMACIDIYQALTESRPYKDGFSHEKSIDIMRDMAEKNMIDATIVEDIYNCWKAS